MTIVDWLQFIIWGMLLLPFSYMAARLVSAAIFKSFVEIVKKNHCCNCYFYYKVKEMCHEEEERIKEEIIKEKEPSKKSS